jgi:5'-methylthioadenosine phosphorylase
VINKNWKMPCLVMIDDFIDFTGELATIHDYFDKRPVHAEMDEPYSKLYQRLMEKAIRPSGIHFYRGTYMQMIGPRLETKAEIGASRTLGADMVGMTHSWEAILAKEYGMKLVSLGMGVNYASGVNNTRLSTDDIMNKSAFLSKKTVGIIRKFIEEL